MGSSDLKVGPPASLPGNGMEMTVPFLSFQGLGKLKKEAKGITCIWVGCTALQRILGQVWRCFLSVCKTLDTQHVSALDDRTPLSIQNQPVVQPPRGGIKRFYVSQSSSTSS
ncbi:hypothetical protein MRB53_007926 [Persea americana]|uniref:Uncharacterized protein n=1 Tax=Persea americana TaxID=3435 RepID=A0ACC2MKM8_PERAE|nr:hypothetical protein MRB53_007926 [Persea americana]